MPGAELSNVAVEILVSLSRAAAHGYAIKLDIEQRVGGQFILGSGALYQALQRLERRGLIGEASGRPAPDNRRGQVYAITAVGRRTLQAEVARMKRLVSQARRLQLRADGSR